MAYVTHAPPITTPATLPLPLSHSRSISNYVIDIKQLSTDSRHAVSVCANLVHATIANPPERRAKERATREREGERGKGSVKGCALRNRANIYVTESCRRTKKVFLVSKEKKSDAEREIDREREKEKKRAVPKERRGEGKRAKRRRIMKTTMGERAPLKLVQFCSRRRASTTTTTTTTRTMVVVVVAAAQYRV